jgi:hypothetical protein
MLRNGWIILMALILLSGKCDDIIEKKINYKDGYILYDFIVDNSIFFIEDSTFFSNRIKDNSTDRKPLLNIYSTLDKDDPLMEENLVKFSLFKYYRGDNILGHEAYFARARVYYSIIDTSREINDKGYDFDSIRINGRVHNFKLGYGSFPDSIKYLNR